MVSKVKKVQEKDGSTTISLISQREAKTNERVLYQINEEKEEVYVFRKGIGDKNDYSILFEGFTSIPKPFSENSNKDDGSLNSLHSRAIDYGFESLIISNKRPNQSTTKNFVICYDDYLALLERNKKFKSQVTTLKRRERSKFLKETFPNIFSGLKTSFPSINESISKEIIDQEVLKRLKYEKLKELVQMSSKVVSDKYGKKTSNFRQVVTVVASIPAIEAAAKKLRIMMDNPKTSELKYHQFLIETFPLLRFDYVHIDTELNLISGGTRKTDFLMINSEGFVDIFEIKKPTLQMLKYDKSHKNFFWSPEASKAIMQIDKYLFYVERNATSIKDIMSKTRNGINIDIVRPRGYLIMGSDKELDEPNKPGQLSDKREDFKILKGSLKNIEILTYSDILRSLTNLVKSNK